MNYTMPRLLLLCLGLVLTLASAHAEIHYRATVIAEGDQAHVVYAPQMNAHGDVVYNAYDDLGEGSVEDSVWLQRANGRTVEVMNPDGFRAFHAVSINDQAVVLGVGYHDSEAGEATDPRGFVYDGRSGSVTFIPLGESGYPEFPHKITQHGDIALGTFDAITHVVSSGRLIPVPTTADLNNNRLALTIEGDRAHLLRINSGERVAWMSSRNVDTGWKLNDRNWAHGIRGQHLYRRRLAPASDPGALYLGPDSYALGDVNNHNQVVGSFTGAGGASRGFVLLVSRLQDLNAITDSLGEWVIEQAVEINDRGQILAVAKAGPFGARTRILRLDPRR